MLVQRPLTANVLPDGNDLILCYFLVSYLYGYGFFFFQAEDGIRDIGVTGVQTCALPIYFRTYIERDGQPALDVACGTGRLLLPLLRAGLDVDGCDLSPDMLALCRAKAERDGLKPRLYAQAMHDLDLPRMYRTIYICDSFGLGGHRQHDREALRRCYRRSEEHTSELQSRQ